MNLEAHCPKCDANLHRDNFEVVDFSDDDEYTELRVDCWQCSWTTAFKIKRFDAEED